MNARLVLPVIWLFVACNVEAARWTADQIEEQRQELGRLSLEDSVRRGRQLDPELKAAIIRSLRETIAGISEDLSLREQYFDYLFNLDDEETIKRYADAYLKDRRFSGAGLFPTCQNPRVIELIAPALFIEDGWVTRGPELAQSFASSVLILRMLGTTPGFDSEVINWARRLPPQIKTYTDVREVMRDWWRENERFFKERNYQAVQPGRDIKRVAEADVAAEVPAGPTTTSKPVSPRSMPVASTLGESPTPSAAFLWTGAGVAIALFVGLVVFWKRRV